MYEPSYDRLKQLLKGNLPSSKEEESWFLDWQKKVEKSEKEWDEQNSDYEDRFNKGYQEALVARYEYLSKCCNKKGKIFFKNYENYKEDIDNFIDKEIDDILTNDEEKANELFYTLGGTHLSSPRISEYRIARRFGIIKEKYGVVIDFDKMESEFLVYSKTLDNIANKYDLSSTALEKAVML